MPRIDALVAEFEREAGTTRRHLERLPEERYSWKPHPKSHAAGALASHLVDCVHLAVSIFGSDELAIDLSTFSPFQAITKEGLLEGFDAAVAEAVQALASADDPEASGPWRLRIDGKVWFEKPREAAFRDMALSHLIHHRGQLTVYLRLLDVPVPATYGPSADER